jgi:hypothetical protein
VSVDGTDTASVEAVKAPPVPGVQKPPRRVGKRSPVDDQSRRGHHCGSKRDERYDSTGLLTDK